MNILFYQPYNQIVVYIESVLEEFARQGHNTYFVSHAEKGETHRNLEKFGCKTYSMPINRSSFLQYYFKRSSVLAKFCKKHNIDVVYSHFQEANLIAVFAQYLCKSKFVINRHHTDCAYLDNNLKEKYGDKIINRLAGTYIATSPKVYDQIVRVEKTNPDKVKLINYGYNFDTFVRPDSKEVERIKKTFATNLLLVKGARFIPEKRHQDLIKSVRDLVDQGFNFKLLLLGRGPTESEIRNSIIEYDLEEHVYVEGFKLNIMDYYSAADLVVHFSLSEASNSAMKEAALTCTPVAVCNDVGDFDEYIVHEENGFIMDKNDPTDDFKSIIKDCLQGKYDLPSIGARLEKDVISRFDIKNVSRTYRELNKSLVNGN